MALDDIEPASTAEVVYELGVPRFPKDSIVYIVESEYSDSGYAAMNHRTFEERFGVYDPERIVQLVKDGMNEAIVLAVPTSSEIYISAGDVIEEVNDLLCKYASSFSDLDLEETIESIGELFSLEDGNPRGYLIEIFEEQ